MKVREKFPDGTSKGLLGYLHTLPSFFTGVARLFDFWGLLDSCDPASRVTDARALNADWRAIGSDIDWAIRSYRRTEPLEE